MFISGIILFITVLQEGIHVNARYVDPQIMTLDDAKYYLDGNHPAEAQEYEVVSPWEVENTRKRRGSDSPVDVSEFKFTAFGEEFHLRLTTNELLTRHGLMVEHVSADGKVEERPLSTEQKDCYKFGRVLSHDGPSRVAVSTCNNGVSGVVKLEGFELFIQKLTDNHTASVQRRRRDLSNPHIVYRRALESEDEDNDEDSRHYCASDFDAYHYQEAHMQMDFPVSNETDEGVEEGSRRRKRNTNCTPTGAKTLELLVVIDSEMRNYHFGSRDVTDYTLTIMNTVASSYMDESLGTFVTIKIVRIVVLTSPSTAYQGGFLSVTNDGPATLDSFCRYQQAVNVLGDSDPMHHDNAILLTRHNLQLNGNDNLLGIAHFSQACNSRFSCALIEEKGFGSGLTTTHELGHNLGIEHDGDTRFSIIAGDCEDGANIMSSSRTNGPNSFLWSTCSKQQLTSFLCEPLGSCLSDNQGVGDHPLDPSEMAGTLQYDADAQCHLIRDDFVGVCPRHTDICGHLACMFSNGICAGTGIAALDGTECGTAGMMCFKGSCITSTGSPGGGVVNGGWSTWSTFGQCSVSCGQGVSRRTRQCTNPVPRNGGQTCLGSTIDSQTCFTQVCPSVVNGGWSSWQYGACSRSCGGGEQTLSRTCTNPAPLNGGLFCTGNNVEVLSCNTQICVVVIHGGWTDWNYSTCTRTCGGGTQTRSRSCSNPSPQNGGSQCSGSNSQNGISCNTQACLVVVHGGWTDWSNYSACTRTCGGGTQTRTRSCSSPTPRNGGSQCSGSNFEFGVSCNTQTCPQVVHGGWTDWNYSACTMTCGGGTQTRTRSCSNPTPQNGGSQCSGINSGGLSCNTQTCPQVVHGGWTDWDYSTCTMTCGGGTQTRTRSCTNPSPRNGGSQCSGILSERGIPCNTQACEVVVHGGWTSWSYGSCSASCGGGTQTRSRSCTNPVPQNGGSQCSGISSEGGILCNTQICPLVPVNGGWTDWNYSACTRTCGGGTQTRSRSCSAPLPRSGGLQCTGGNFESGITCNTQNCGGSTNTERGTFNGGRYGEYVEFVTIPVGASLVTVTNRNALTHMAIKHGNSYALGYNEDLVLPPRGQTQHNYLGMLIVYNFGASETITIAGPTTVELKMVVRVILDPTVYVYDKVLGNITWEYSTTVNNNYQWISTTGTCSVTCGTGERPDVLVCAEMIHDNRYNLVDSSFCSSLIQPTPAVHTCYREECPAQVPDARWFVGNLDCSGLCGQATANRGVFCVAVSGQQNGQVVDEALCADETKPPEIGQCQNLPPCQEVSGTTLDSCNEVVKTQGAVNRMYAQTGGAVCSYTIVAPPGMLISLHLVDFVITCPGEGQSLDSSEQLILKDSYREVIDVCASNLQPGVIRRSWSNVMQIEHLTRHVNHGYQITYSFVPSNSAASGCDEVLTSDRGMIMSPGYPGNYPSNTQCTKDIVAPADKKIEIDFSHFNLYPWCSSKNPLHYDYVKIQDYEEDQYHWFCGQFSNPSALSRASSSNRVRVTFRSNFFGSGRGFQLGYTFVPRD